MLSTSSTRQFQASLHGELIERGDPRYEDACRLYNGMIVKRPLLIARCADVADVVNAVRFGRQNDLLTAIRGGGHNGPGLGSCDDGLVIDLSPMKAVRVDPTHRTVQAAGGCTQGDVDRASHPFGLAVPGGVVSTTGIGGLTLGGGHGYLSRQYGLTIDNLLEADVVLADGSFVTASGSHREDLFWALRGGGGNFGVVTRFAFRARPVDTVYGGPILWDLQDARRVMQWYRTFLPAAPVELNPFLALLTVPSAEPFPGPIRGRKSCGLVCCYNGPAEDAERALQPIRRDLPPPMLDAAGPMPFPALQSMFDPLYPKGLQWYWKADFVKDLPDEAIDAHLEQIRRTPSELSTIHMYPIDGAVHEVRPEQTAWSCRDATWSMFMAGIDPDPAKAQALAAWARDYWQAVHPYSLGGAYVNFMMDEGADRVKATYGDNYERLTAVKRKYDPDNFFRVNQNIKPARG